MYVDCIHLRKDELIRVVERVDGKRIFRDIPTDHHFFVKDPKGPFRSIFGDPLKKLNPKGFEEKIKLVNQLVGQKFESDANPIFRALEQNYLNSQTPNLHIAFFDIETAFCDERGYASANEPFNPITSIAVYLQWAKQMVCMAVPPKTLSWEEANEIADTVPDVLLFKTEEEMLNAFLSVIEDADVLSGWNSDMFDIPYVTNRITMILGKSETRRLCLWSMLPKVRKFERNGKESYTYDLQGRVHLDLMELYKKYTYEERHSFSLNSIAEHELKEQKVEYSGTLEQLYRNDFKKFLEYNIQDTMLLDRLEQKLQYIDLCSTIAHANCVLMPTTMGTVAITDQAVTIEAHSRNLIVPDNTFSNDDTRAAGGWVATPKKGMHKWVGSSDLKSLYPSVIRTLNMSPETIVGQVRLDKTYKAIDDFIAAAKRNKFADWWNDRFCPLEMEPYFSNDNSQKITLVMESGDQYEVTGRELRKLIFNSGQPWLISANGTIFKTDVEGIVPSLLSRWYAERKALQGVLKNYSLLDDNEKTAGIIVPEELFGLSDVEDSYILSNSYNQGTTFKPSTLLNLIEEKDKKRVVDYINYHGLTVKNSKVIARDQVENKKIQMYWDKRQHVRKISLNSAYGALLNAGSRFYDHRIGQSTTLTGRNITKHMAAKTNEFITGIYDHYGEGCIYGDSVTEDSILQTPNGSITIKDYFDKQCSDHITAEGREYMKECNLKVLSFNNTTKKPFFGEVEYAYRHKTVKTLYDIEDENGNIVTVTEDHSVMVLRDNCLIEVKPNNIEENDQLVSVSIT